MQHPAFAISDDIASATAGDYLLIPVDGSQGCLVHLYNEKTIGGYRAEEKKPCADNSPLHDTVAAWDFENGGMIFRDATRKQIIMLEEQEGGPYRTPSDVTPKMLLVPDPPKDVDRAPVANKLFGDWVLRDKKGNQLCDMELSSAPFGGDEASYTLSIGAKCAARFKKLKLNSWYVEEFSLGLYSSDGESIMLTPYGDGGFIDFDTGQRFKPADLE